MVLEATSGNFSVGAATTNNADSGRASGWRIGDGLQVVSLTRQSATSDWTAQTGELRIAVRGYANSRATGAPEISGSNRVGATLSAMQGTVADGNGIPTNALTYQWIRVDGATETDIEGATANTYQLGVDDAGKQIKVKLSFTDSNGFSESRTSPASRTIEPFVRCNPSDHNELWCATLTLGASGTFTGFRHSSYGDVAPASFTARTATLSVRQLTYNSSNGNIALELRRTGGTTPSDGFFGNRAHHLVIGQGFDARVFAFTDDSTRTSTSTTITIPGQTLSWVEGELVAVRLVHIPNRRALGAPAIFGTARVGQVLSALKGTISDGNGIPFDVEYQYQWVRVSGATESDIQGETSRTYRLTSQDEGNQVKVRMSFTDEVGYDESRTSAAFPAGRTVGPVVSCNAADTDELLCSVLTVAESGSQRGYRSSAPAYGTLVPDTFTWRGSTIEVTRLDYTSAGQLQVRIERTSGTPQTDGLLGPYTFALELGVGHRRGVFIVESTAGDATQTFQEFTFSNHGLAWSADDAVGVKLRRINDPASGVPEIEGTARVGETLTATRGNLADADGIPNNVAFAYQWLRVSGTRESVITGAEARTYTVTTSDRGKRIRVKMSFTDSEGNRESRTSPAFPARGTIGAALPAPRPLRCDSTDPNEIWCATLTVGESPFETGHGRVAGYLWAGKPARGSLSPSASFSWRSRSIDIEHLFIDGMNQLGFRIQPGTGTTVPSDGLLGTGRFALQIEINGDATDFDIVHPGTTTEFQWMRVDMPRWENGASVRVRLVRKAAPGNSPALGQAEISGTGQVNQNLTAVTDKITDRNGIGDAFTYQWFRVEEGGTATPITGARGDTYKLDMVDEDKWVKVRVSFTDLDGYSEAVESQVFPDGPITGSSTAAAAATGSPTIRRTSRTSLSQCLHQPDVFVVSLEDIEDDNGLYTGRPQGHSATLACGAGYASNCAFQWIRVATGRVVTNISGATEREYAYDSADEDKKVMVQVKFTDRSGNRETVTSAPFPEGTQGLSSRAGRPPPEFLAACSPPTVANVNVSGSNASGAWEVGETVRVTFTYDRQVYARLDSGAPSIRIRLGGPGGAIRMATLRASSKSNKVVFDYRVEAGDGNPSRVAVIENSLAFNGGRIFDVGGRNARALLENPSADVDATVPACGSYTDEIWCSTLTVGSGAGTGYNASFGSLSTPDIQYGDVRLRVSGLFLDARKRLRLQLSTGTLATFNKAGFSLQTALRMFKFPVDGTDSAQAGHWRNAEVGWRTGEQVIVRIRGPRGSGDSACGTPYPQEVWCGTLTVGSGSGATGYVEGSFGFGTLTTTMFTHDGTDYTVEEVFHRNSTLSFHTEPAADNAFNFRGFTLLVRHARYAMPADSVSGSGILQWSNAVPGWTDGESVIVRLIGGLEEEVIPPPTIVGAPVVSGAGEDGYWSRNEMVRVTVTFSEPVEVDTTNGTPSIGVGFTRVDRRADYQRGSGTNELVFEYTRTVARDGVGDRTFAHVGASTLRLNGGTIRSVETGVDAELGHQGVAASGFAARGAGPEVILSNFPDNHDGDNRFKVTLHFSGPPSGLSAKRDGTSVLEVEGGTVTGAREETKDPGSPWEVTIEPDGDEEVTVRVPVRECGEPGAVCINGEPLARMAEKTVPGPETLPVVSIAASTTPVTEGTAAAFTVTRTGATDAALTVTVSVTESGSVLEGEAPSSVTIEADSASATLSVATEDDTAAEAASTITATLTADDGYTVDDASDSAEVVVQDDDGTAPVVTTASPIEVAEGATTVATLVATDADTPVEDLSWSIPEGADGGADASAFELTEDGVLTFRAAKDFESPDDENTDGDYEITVRVTDGVNPVDASLIVRLTAADETPPTLSSATIDGATLLLTFDQALDEDSEPAGSAFAVTVGGDSRTVDTVDVTGRTTTLTLASPVTADDAVTVAYTAPTDSDPGLQDAAGNQVADIASTQVTNETTALPVVSITAAPTPVTEGTSASFTLTRTGSTSAALEVSVSVSEAGSVLDGTPPVSVTFSAETAQTQLAVATLDDTTHEADAQITASVVAGQGYTVDSTGASAAVDVFDNDTAPTQGQEAVETLWSTTMRWADVGEGWFGGYDTAFADPEWTEDGTTYRIWYISYYAPDRELGFMHNGTGGYIADPDELSLQIGDYTVEPGEAMTAFAKVRAATVSDIDSKWPVGEDITIRLTRSTGETRTTPAGPAVSVDDAQVNESAGLPLRFVVRLAEPATGTVSVRYTTSDGSAVAGEDYTAARGAVRFSPGQQSKTVEVAVLEDGHDEGSETMTLTLSRPFGATLSDADATGTISNTDPMPKAWLARFGRTVAEQAIDAVQTRFDAWRETGLTGTLAGAPLGGVAQGEDFTSREEAEHGLGTVTGWLRGENEEDDDASRFGESTLSPNELLASTSFSLTRGTAEDGFASLWGTGAVTTFDGREGEMTLDGEVSSAMVGADWSRDALLAGLMLSHSRGEGGYQGETGTGTVESTLTALFPYARYALSERLSVWGMTGYGEGTMTLTPEGGTPLRPDMDFLMGAVGVRGVLVDGGDDGVTLTAKSDAFAVRTGTDAVSGPDGDLDAAEADVTRLRFAFERSRSYALNDSATFVPSIELGVRYDGGDAETGFGADIGTGLALSDASRGLSAEVRARGLLTHEADGLSEQGLSGTVAFDPTPETERGLSLSLTQTVGADTWGGTDSLLERTTLAGLGAEDESLSGRRLDGRVGYGVSVFDDAFTAIPEVGLGLSDTDHELRLGWRLVERVSTGLAFELGLQGTRRAYTAIDADTEGAVEHGLVAGAGWRLVSRGMESLELRIEAAHIDAASGDAGAEHSIGVRVGASW